MSYAKPVTARGRRTRQKLLKASEEIFGQLGYDAASVSEITRRAGVAQGTFYIHFPDKKAVFVELVRELNHALRKEIATAVNVLQSRLDIEERGFRAFFNFVLEHRNLYKIVRQAEFVDEETYRWYYESLAEAYARGLERAMDAGELRRLDPECLAYCLMGIGDFLGMRWVLWEERQPPDEVFQSMMTLIRAGLANENGSP